MIVMGAPCMIYHTQRQALTHICAHTCTVEVMELCTHQNEYNLENKQDTGLTIKE